MHTSASLLPWYASSTSDALFLSVTLSPYQQSAELNPYLLVYTCYCINTYLSKSNSFFNLNLWSLMKFSQKFRSGAYGQLVIAKTSASSNASLTMRVLWMVALSKKSTNSWPSYRWLSFSEAITSITKSLKSSDLLYDSLICNVTIADPVTAAIILMPGFLSWLYRKLSLPLGTQL